MSPDSASYSEWTIQIELKPTAQLRYLRIMLLEQRSRILQNLVTIDLSAALRCACCLATEHT